MWYFTIPDTLNMLVYQNQRELYPIIFRAAAEAMRELSEKKKYLGRYTRQVTFKWKDYKDNSTWKVMTISAAEFIRRFLMHILPYRFMKIRHYGFLRNRGKMKRLKICKTLTDTPILPRLKLTTAQLIQKLTGVNPNLCPVCGSDKLNRLPVVDSS